jgi:2'-5' RNA ligase
MRCGRQVARRLHAWASRLAADDRALRIPAVEDLHLTLQFLGPTPQSDIAPIGRALQSVAAEHAPVEVTYPRIGAFPDVRRPRVLWAGVEAPAGALGELARALGAALEPLGYRPERRAFHAHVTLARVHRRPGAAVLRALEEAAAPGAGDEILSEVKLMLSDPAHRPYHYIDLTTADLGGSPPAPAGPPNGRRRR